MLVKIKKLSELAEIPTYAKDGDAGMDLVATSIISETDTQITYGLGIALEIPYGFVGLVFPRSSIRKTRLQLSNSVGVIDSGYRGELQATFNKIHTTIENQKNDYKIGDRVAQIMIIPHPPIEFDAVDELSDTERGDGGFGSTGK
jgi:dUTP pyrophosphatase